MTDDTANKIRIYSPVQVTTASFLGGPFAAVFVLKKNFDALGEQRRAKLSLIFGSVFMIAIFSITPFLPAKFPRMLLPLAYSIGAREIAKKYQLTKQAILVSEQYRFQSNWNVIGISVGFFVLFLLTFGLGLFGLLTLGVIDLHQY